jgi:hypothetical protein
MHIPAIVKNRLFPGVSPLLRVSIRIYTNWSCYLNPCNLIGENSDFWEFVLTTLRILHKFFDQIGFYEAFAEQFLLYQFCTPAPHQYFAE